MSALVAVNDPRDTLGDGPGRHAPPEQPRRELEAATATAPWPISRPCSIEYRALRTSGDRPTKSISLAVVHCTQGLTARGAAAWFQNPDARGSANLVVDGRECFRTLPPSMIPWGAYGANVRGWHLEIAGYAEWSTQQWLEHRATLERAAFKLALHLRSFDIPCRYLSDRQLAGGVLAGIVSHRACTRVYGGTHTDPGADFPWDYFLRRTRFYFDQADV